jgi:excisionase family DNA binding protein
MEHAAALLGVSRRTVYYRIRDGKLQTVRTFGSQRVLLASIEALLRDERGVATDSDATASVTAISAKCPASGPRLPPGRDVPGGRS